MKKVAIVGLGWLGMPLALSLLARGYQVVGSKTRPDGVEAARMSGIECYQLNLTPLPEADPDDLAALFQADALIITLPASRTVEGADNYSWRSSRWWTARWRPRCRALFSPARRRCMAKVPA